MLTEDREEDVNPDLDPVLAETKAKGLDWSWSLIVLGYGCGWYLFYFSCVLCFAVLSKLSKMNISYF